MMIYVNAAKRLLAAYLYNSGAFSRYVNELLSQRVIVPICDHNPSPQQFKKITDWLRNRGFGFLASEELCEFLEKKYRPKKSMIWYTFDDGWAGNYDLLDFIEDEHVPVTIFLNTEPVKTGIFRDTVERYLPTLLPDVNTRTLISREESYREQIHKSARKRATQKLPREALTAEQVRILARHPLVTIGAHTHHHAALTNCDAGQINSEITENINYIQEYTGEEPKYFAFPYGLFDDDVLAIVKSFEFKFLATISKGIITPETNRHILPRNLVPEGSDREIFCRILNYWYPLRQKVETFFNARRR